VIRRLLAKPWDTEDVAKLKELANSGASALRPCEPRALSRTCDTDSLRERPLGA
jgi:hypothetical protein